MSSRVTTCASPARMFLLRLGNWVTNRAPKNQNHEMPSTESSTVRLPRRNWKLRQVSVITFQLILRSGSAAGAGST
ncbi:hypothetical protein D3C83_17280 [compost metagenome]